MVAPATTSTSARTVRDATSALAPGASVAIGTVRFALPAPRANGVVAGAGRDARHRRGERHPPCAERLQGATELDDVPEATRGILLQRTCDDLGERRRRRAHEWHRASQHAMKHDAQRPDIDAMIDGLRGEQLLRRHVARRSDGRVRRREIDPALLKSTASPVGITLRILSSEARS